MMLVKTSWQLDQSIQAKDKLRASLIIGMKYRLGTSVCKAKAHRLRASLWTIRLKRVQVQSIRQNVAISCGSVPGSRRNSPFSKFLSRSN